MDELDELYRRLASDRHLRYRGRYSCRSILSFFRVTRPDLRTDPRFEPRFLAACEAERARPPETWRPLDGP